MKRFVIILLAVSLVIAGLVSWFTSPHPDGLDRVAEDHGFSEKAKNPSFELFPDYTISGLSAFWSNGIAGILGTIVVLVTVTILGKLISRKKTN